VSDERRDAWALFRFNVIAPLLESGLDGAEKTLIRKQILSEIYTTPDGKKWNISERTLRKWVARYRQSGLEGLRNRQHKLRGQMKAIDDGVLAKARKLREAMRSRSISDILVHLKMRGIDVSNISATTLNRHLNRVGASKEKNYEDRGAFQRFSKEHINQLWQTDCTDGIWLPDPLGLKEVRKTTLITFIDDCSRFCVHGQFYFTARLEDLLDCFKKALLSRGKSSTVYSDNGSIYRATDWSNICGELDIGVRHSQEYRPPGKGKQERHYLTIKRRLYKEAEKSGLQTLQELNEFFWAWLDQVYHRTEHKELKTTPIERWQMEEHLIQRLSLETLEQKMQRRAYRDVDFKTSLIRLNGKLYQASQNLAGVKKVQVRWPFDDESAVNIWRDGVFVEQAKLFAPAPDIDYSRRPQHKKEEEPSVLDCSKQLRLAMVAKYRGEKAPEDTSKYGFLTEREFAFVIERYLGISLTDVDRASLSQSYRRLSPIDADFVQNCLTRAIASKGPNRHLNFYLNEMEEKKAQRR
jgi:transposase InsO family protein